MATLRQSLAIIVGIAGLSPLGCGKSVGLGGTVTPLAHIHVQVTGDLPPEVAGDSTHLHLALLWGLQWQPEPFCAFSPPGAEAVVAAGCPDNFGFVPNPAGSAADVAFQPGAPATLDLMGLPTAGVMVGNLTSRIAYGSIVLYDDVNQNGVLDLRTPPRFRRRNNQPPIAYDGGVTGPRDIVFGASFISMTKPDMRVAFLEGTFDNTVAFYPRAGCTPDPPKEFSILSTGGFSSADTSALLAGQPLPSGLRFPEETSCATGSIDDPIVIDLSAQTVDSGQTVDPAQLAQLACTVDPESGSGPNYRAAPTNAPDTVSHTCACTSFPHIPGDDAGITTGQQFVCASAPSEACRYVFHYTLRGCDNDPSCASPSWDITATPPDWWKCSTSP
jgi:hypothetical protein